VASELLVLAALLLALSPFLLPNPSPLSPLYLIDPLLLLGCSVLLVAVSVTALLVAAFPVIQDVSRAARSAEKLFDRLDRELPPTLEAIRLAGMELSDLGEEVAQGVQSASMVVQQVDRGIVEAKQQAGNLTNTTKSVWVGVKAAWQTWRDRGESLDRRSISPDPRSLQSDYLDAGVKRDLDYLHESMLDADD
jgi:hypothetical protein